VPYAFLGSAIYEERNMKKNRFQKVSAALTTKFPALTLFGLALLLLLAGCDVNKNDDLTNLTGTVTINGEVEVGKTLTAAIGNFPDGAIPVFQWQRVKEETITDISGKTGPDYTVQESDIGFQIRVSVSCKGYRGVIFDTTDTVISVHSIVRQLQTLAAMSPMPAKYTITVYHDESIGGSVLNYSGSVIEITLRGALNENNTLTLNAAGAMFTVREGVTLILEDVVLAGRSGNNNPLININSGSLIMNNGAVIKDNTNENTSSNMGGGVIVTTNGTFTMNGGAITGNSSYSGGGVLNLGKFYLNGGEITGNTSDTNSGISASGEGGGVHNQSDFIMKGGKISGNTAAYGGGVTNWKNFYMLGGEISANEAAEGSGGVSNFNNFGTGTAFYIQDGIIYGSNAPENLKNTGAKYDALSSGNMASAQHGIFSEPDAAENSVFEKKGDLPNANYTINIVNGELTGSLGATSVTVTGISSEYHGKTAVLAALVNGFNVPWEAFSKPAAISDSVNIALLEPVPAQTMELRLYILDMPPEDYSNIYFNYDNYKDKAMKIFRAKINLELENTTAAITLFSELVPTAIVITDLPELVCSVCKELYPDNPTFYTMNLWLFDRDVANFGQPQGLLGYYGQVARISGTAISGTVTIRDIAPREYKLTMQLKCPVENTTKEEYYFTINVTADTNNIISFNDMVKQ